MEHKTNKMDNTLKPFETKVNSSEVLVVSAVRTADVKGKELCYITVTSKTGEIIAINIGEKNYAALDKMISDLKPPKK